MRIQLAMIDRQTAGQHRLTKLFLASALAGTVVGAGACAQNGPPQSEARLGAGGAGDSHRWNGSAARKGYGSKDLGAPNGGSSSASGSSGDTVLFTSDSTDLTPEAKAILDGYVDHLRQKRVRSLSIEGHADERGTREYNIGLGARRAATVKSHLLSKGMLESQIKTISYGKERPIATCDDISCWARNRRAQLIVAE